MGTATIKSAKKVTKKATRKLTKKITKKILSSKKLFKGGDSGSTINYDMIKAIADNRGIESGFERTRIDKHKNDMESGRYMDMGQDIVINIYGDLIDGSHRLKARMERDEPVKYYVTTSDTLNSTCEKTRFIAISYLNSHSSQWTKAGTYKSSLKKGLRLAKVIKDLIDEVSMETGIITNKIEISWLFSLLKQDIKYFSSSKELNTAEIYDNKELCDYSKTPEFMVDFENFIELINIFKGFTRYNNITKFILKLHWTNSNFDINHMFKNLRKYRFTLRDGYKTVDIKAEIDRVYNMKKSHKNYVKLF